MGTRRASDGSSPNAVVEFERQLLERTGQLSAANEALRLQIDERERAESALTAARADAERRLRELALTQSVLNRNQKALDMAQAELAHVTRLAALGELTATLAHELTQPLVAIALNAAACVRWLGCDTPDLDQARDATQRIIRDARRGGDIIEHTRRLAKKEGEERTPLDITNAIREVLALVGPEIRSNDITIRESFAEDLPAVSCVRVQIQQVLLNLLLNGIEAIKCASGSIRELAITLQRVQDEGGDGVLVAVKDSGVGVSEDELPRLFDAFHTTKPGGLGLGLTISRSIVQEHGGRLWANANVDHGATFRFVLPVST